MKKQKKQSARKRAKYPALNPRYMPKVRQEYMDIDYIDKLSDEELKWLNKFMDEELNASFKNNKKDLVTDPEEKRAIYNKNNARNRCVFGIAKATGTLDYKENAHDIESVANPQVYEDLLIEEIDRKRKG
jgi:hypothetical protein